VQLQKLVTPQVDGLANLPKPCVAGSNPAGGTLSTCDKWPLNRDFTTQVSWPTPSLTVTAWHEKPLPVH